METDTPRIFTRPSHPPPPLSFLCSPVHASVRSYIPAYLHSSLQLQTYTAVCERYNTWQAYAASVGVLFFTCIWLGEIAIQLLAVFRDGVSATVSAFMHDPLNWLECVSIVASLIANSLALAMGAAEGEFKLYFMFRSISCESFSPALGLQ